MKYFIRSFSDSSAELNIGDNVTKQITVRFRQMAQHFQKQ